MISVIVPVYNVEKYLDCCIKSILNQSYSDLEIILVDDGSPDNCPMLCDAWAKRDQRIKVIHKENGGLSDARNTGLAVATGSMIGFVDADDWIGPRMYELLEKALNDDKSDIAACTVKEVWDNGKQEFLTVQERSVLKALDAQIALLEESKLKQPVWYKLYKRDVVKGILFEKNTINEDVLWSSFVIGNANTVSIIDYVGYYYRQHENSIMGKSYSFERISVVNSYCKIYEYMKRSSPSLSAKAKQKILLGCIYHGQMSLRYLTVNEIKKAFSFFTRIRNNYKIDKEVLSISDSTQKIWLLLSAISLKLTCRIKNMLKVGF